MATTKVKKKMSNNKETQILRLQKLFTNTSAWK